MGDLLLEGDRIIQCDRKTGKRLLDEVSIGINEGDRLALIGPSGAGKSILLRALAALDPLNGGRVRWRGREILCSDVPAFRGNVLYMPQRSLPIQNTVREEVLLGFQFLGRTRLPEDDSYIDCLFKAVGKERTFLDQRCRDLSVGEGQLVALIRAMTCQPRILLLDEPTASLDQKTVRVVEEWIMSWAMTGRMPRAFVWVSHDHDQTRRVANRIVHLEAGRWVRDGA